MKVLLLNGSPHAHGCTDTALREIAATLAAEKIDSEIVHIENTVHSCMACGYCKKQSQPRCAYDGDSLNKLLTRIDEFDALIIGSPVHYASASGAVTAFCDRLFYAAAAHLAFKPGAAIASARRAGTTATLDQLNKYFTINQMPIVSSVYWNMVHGNTPDEVLQDEEGLQIMRTLGRNLAWLLHSIEAGRQAGIERPAAEPRRNTNFIR